MDDISKLLTTVNSPDVVLRLKVNSIGRMRRMYKNLIENQDVLLKIKMANDGRIPRGLLLEGKPAIRNALKEFELA
jgi:hypothetical protein